jgi:vacuolar-type H+-ATPase subunit I/STV1
LSLELCVFAFRFSLVAGRGSSFPARPCKTQDVDREMIRFLLVVSIFCALGAAGLGFLNRAKLTKLSEDLGESRSANAKTGTQLNDLQQKLKQTEDRLSTQERLTQQERDARSSELNTTKAKLNQTTEQLAARDSENKALTAALTEAGRNLEQKQRAEQDRQALGRRLIDVEDELNQYRFDANKAKLRPPVPLEGSILSINQEAKALTVSLGTDSGVAANSRLTVMRNGEKLTQLRVVSAGLNTCVAEFASAAPDNLSKVAVGDSVLLATK